MAARLRVATSGTGPAVARDYGNGTATAGRALVSAGPDVPPTWGDVPSENLTTVRFVDGGTTVPTANQRGTILAPYRTFAQAFVDLPAGGVIRAIPFDYSAQGVLNCTATGTIQIVGFAGDWGNAIYLGGNSPTNRIRIAGITTTHGLMLQSVNVTGAVTVAADDCWVHHCTFDSGLQVPTLYAEFCAFGVGAGIVTTSNTSFVNCSFSRDILTGRILQTTSPQDPVFRDCLFLSTPVMQFNGGSSGFAQMDNTTLERWLLAGGLFSGGQYRPLTAPLSGIFIAAPVGLPPGITVLATVALPADTFSSDVGVFVGPCGVRKTDGVIYSGSFIIATNSIELYADNYTDNPLAEWPGQTLRWKLFAP